MVYCLRMARPKSPLTHFILSIPTLSAKEVVAKAKERGMETSEKNVHRVRSLPKGPEAKKTSVTANAASKGASSNKSAFVRGPPGTLRPKEVVAKAKAAGMTLTEKHVQVTRSKAKQAPHQRVVAAAAPTKKAAGPVVPKGAKTTMNKAEFVRSLPATTPAKEVSQKAKAAGLSIAVEYVYKVRAKMGAKSKRVASKPAATKTTNGQHATTGAAAPASWKNLEQIFIGAAFDMGLARAAEILETVRAKVRAFTA